MKVQISYHGKRPKKPWRVRVDGNRSVYLQDEKTAKQVRKLLYLIQPSKTPWGDGPEPNTDDRGTSMADHPLFNRRK